ncbi:MAG: nucleotide exchange factor GrpE [Acholeplasmatales bacterium]|nr:nucleotide exchange factor GrpE [Acholeplasmatales bacterium]
MQEEEIKETATEEEVKEENSTSEKVEKKENKKEKKDKHKEEIAKLEAKNKELEEKYAELKNEYLKAYAELENTKKRIKQEQITDRKYASQKVVGELIGPVDMLNMIINMPTQSPEVQNYVIGFQMITNQLVDILKAEGLGPINCKALDEFDPKIMQVVDTRYEEDKADNVVLEVKQAGYMYKDRVLRTAMVVVNKKPEVKKEVNEDVIENKE